MDNKSKGRGPEAWTKMVRGYTTGMTDDQVKEVVRRMVANEAAGVLTTCIWHEAAAVCGKPCWCSKCRPEIKRIA